MGCANSVLPQTINLLLPKLKLFIKFYSLLRIIENVDT